MANVALPQISIDSSSSTPLYRQLAAGLRSAVALGSLRSGARLPTTRSLADQLGLGRNTTVEAYALLQAEGLLYSLGRLGTFVHSRDEPLALHLLKTHAEPQLAQRLHVAAGSSSSAALDWRLGQVSTQLLPLASWRAACKEAGRHLPPPHYGDPRGDAGLRDALRVWLQRQRGLEVDVNQIIVTQGAAQAIELLAQLLVRAGDMCAVENPGYPRAAQSLLQAGGDVMGIDVDDKGLVVAQLAGGSRAPALAHVTPAHQYPLGGRLSGPRRRQLLAFAKQHGTLIIENEYDYEFIHTGPNHAPLFASAPEQVVLVSTFAKAISPSLRVGFIVAPRRIADGLAQLIEKEKRHVSWPVQISLRWLLQSGELERHLRRVRRHYLQLQKIVCNQLEQLAPHITVRGFEGGLHVVCVVRTRQMLFRIEQQLIKKNIWLDKLSAFEVLASRHAAILFGYGHMSKEELALAVNILARCLKRTT